MHALGHQKAEEVEFRRGSSKQKEEEEDEQPTALPTNRPRCSCLRPRNEMRMMESLLSTSGVRHCKWVADKPATEMDTYQCG